ncbi:hypothetical protein HC931_08030 [Candidatus Gracilibacteria bacterium]|nr:hypothetical protein [Candidatus Gracilibacteria bacterium]NJM87106.1 hypothetical protein [Hydrococcus sp. RU_2_2]
MQHLSGQSKQVILLSLYLFERVKLDKIIGRIGKARSQLGDRVIELKLMAILILMRYRARDAIYRVFTGVQ